MKKLVRFLFLGISFVHAQGVKPSAASQLTDSVVEPWTYRENFEQRLLGAWASYPLWQDLAYDQNFRTNEIVPGDKNISLVQKVTSYTAVDCYAGAQKKLDMYLVPGAALRFRYYLKTSQQPAFYKIRFAAGKYGKLDVTLVNPSANRWVTVNLGFDDFARENPSIKGLDTVRVYALAFLANIPGADPAMPIYLGLDDIVFTGARATAFRFAQPAVFKLPEFTPYIPQKQYNTGDTFHLSGSWPAQAKKVTLQISAYTKDLDVLYKAALYREKENWALRPLKLSYPEGLYIGKLTGFGDGGRQLYNTSFTIHIVSKSLGGRHPRLLFDGDKKKWLAARFKEPRFAVIYADILKNAKIQREQVPVSSLHYDLDQYPDEDWLPTAQAWKSHFLITGEGLWNNALAYAFEGDRTAGEYVKNILLTLAAWPDWGHPWQAKRGRFSEHNTGTWSYRVAEAYDLTYDLMTAGERAIIRKAIQEKIVEAVHRTYIYDNNVTGNTSNWLAATVGGSLMNIAAIFDDDERDTVSSEPFFTGALMKLHSFITNVTDRKDGAWGEGLGYNTYSFHNLSQSVPALKNVFGIDLSPLLRNSYNEYIWASNLEKKQFFNFGDAALGLVPMPNWAFLLDMQKEPRLSWLYNSLKKEETFEDVLYDTKNTEQQDPFKENPDKIFHELGTTVFKSGWGKDDFSFVMRTGAFYNHQHLDQGSFWLSDHGVTFIGEHKGSAYYDDPLYQSWFIQPVSHSTLLIDGNQQSQRTGDELHFAPGFDDHAFISQSLDGKEAAFSSGDIGRLYWGRIKSLSRNVLFLKPRTLLMLDVAEPAEKDADLTLLYPASALKDINAGQHASSITKDGFTLHILHLAPDSIQAKAVETPHYLNTLLNDKPLIREGMLTVTGRTAGQPLVIANILTTTAADIAPAITSEVKDGFITGVASGKRFAFSTKPGGIYTVGDIQTDALALTFTGDRFFAARTTFLHPSGELTLSCTIPITFELEGNNVRYDSPAACTFTIIKDNKSSSIRLSSGEGSFQIH